MHAAHRIRIYRTLHTAAGSTLTQPSLWRPAVILLLPTLLLQLAAPTYLRTRLSPSPVFVVIGSLALVLLTQLVLPAVFALVHARRNGRQAPATPVLARASLRAGLRAFLGLVAFVLHGLWLQARYSFAGIYAAADDPLRASTIATRRAIWPLTMLVVTALFASLIGQSLVAVLNENLGVVEQASVGGRIVFQLHYLPHAVTSVVAYLWSAATVTFQAIAVSEILTEVEIPADERHSRRQGTAVLASGNRGRDRLHRLIKAVGAIVLICGLAALVYKAQQHF